jgi:hypothetical protein
VPLRCHPAILTDRVPSTLPGVHGLTTLRTGLKVRVLERKPLPATSTVLVAGCGGDGAFRWLDVDLDESPPRATPGFRANAVEGLRGEVSDKQLTPIRFPYSVSLSDAEPFLITARTRRCDCAWVAEVTWASEGRTGTTVIDDGGRPFRSTAITNASAECHIDTAGVACR